MAPVFLSTLTFTSVKPAFKEASKMAKRSSNDFVWSLMAFTMASVEFNKEVESNLPVSSIWRRSNSPLLFMATTMLLPCSSILPERVVNPLNMEVFTSFNPCSVFSLRTLMAPVLESMASLISTILLFSS